MDSIDLRDLSLDELREVLGVIGEDLPAEQLLKVAEYVAQIGNLDEAIAAIDAISKLRDAA